uniref:Uncharacterized protein n=1 Tax=Siphoviridae sp. ctVDy27 TaxID=2827881 RepID=A0A8S5S6U4_9CAUD|nr:MAG TPA: hypothetical protein [Siphoviridae sp. ctVDy27]
MSNSEILKRAKELVELLEKQEKSCRVRLSELNPGDIFQTTGKRKYKVLEQCAEYTRIISLGFVKENVKFNDGTTDYNKSSLKKLCDTEILEDFEEEFGEENIETEISDLITVDGQKIGVVKCKVRPLTFDEARKYTELTPNNELNDPYWTCSAWSTAERGWRYALAVVSPSGGVVNGSCLSSRGVRPVCILKSNIFVSKVEEE